MINDILLLLDNANEASQSFNWSLFVAVASAVLSAIALLVTIYEYFKRRYYDFRDVVLSHLNGLLDLYNDCVLIVDDKHVVQEDAKFIEIEKQLLKDFNYLYSYGKLTDKQGLVDFATFTPKRPSESFACVLMKVENEYKEVRSAYKLSKSEKDFIKIKEYLKIFTKFLDLSYKYIKSVLYQNNEKSAQDLYDKLRKYYYKKI